MLFLLSLKIGMWITNTIHQWMGYSQRVLIFVSPKQRQRHFRKHMHCSAVWTGLSRTAENKTLKISYWFRSLRFSFAGKESSRPLRSRNLSAAEEQPPHLGAALPRMTDSWNLNLCPWGEAHYPEQLMSDRSKMKLHAHPKLLQRDFWITEYFHVSPLKRSATHAEVLYHRKACQGATPNTFWKLCGVLKTKLKFFLDKTATKLYFRTIFVCVIIKEIPK